MEQIINEWFTDHFHNSPASRDTEVYNLILAAKDDLLKRLITPEKTGQTTTNKEV